MIMLQYLLLDTHLRMSCRREEDLRIGLIVSAVNWAGIPDRSRRVLRNGLVSLGRVWID